MADGSIAAVKKTGASLSRGSSRQDWATPPVFLAAARKRFGAIGFDLAASAENTAAPAYFTEKDNSLKQDWSNIANAQGRRVLVAWCNPPFNDIRPWAAKCEAVRHLPRWTLLLVPASMGSLWWRDHAIGKCHADGVTRMTFVGAEDPYPKDLALLAYGFGVSGTGFWDWRTT